MPAPLRVQRTKTTLNKLKKHYSDIHQFHIREEQEKIDVLSTTNEELEKLVESQNEVLKISAKLCESAADTKHFSPVQVSGLFFREEFEATEDLQTDCDDKTKGAINKFQNGFKKLLTRIKKNVEESTKCAGCANESNTCVCVLKEKLQSVKTQWSVCRQDISSDDRAEKKADQLTRALDLLSSVVDNQMKKTQLLEDGVRGVLHNVDQIEYFAGDISRVNSAICELNTKTNEPTRLEKHQDQIQQQLQTKQELLKDVQENMSLQIKSASKRRGELMELMSSTSPTTTTEIGTQTDEPPNALNDAETDTNPISGTQKARSCIRQNNKSRLKPLNMAQTKTKEPETVSPRRTGGPVATQWKSCPPSATSDATRGKAPRKVTNGYATIAYPVPNTTVGKERPQKRVNARRLSVPRTGAAQLLPAVRQNPQQERTIVGTSVKHGTTYRQVNGTGLESGSAHERLSKPRHSVDHSHKSDERKEEKTPLVPHNFDLPMSGRSTIRLAHY